ncbi:MAG: toll/interleukin-1 receptor domain-containing protein [Acidobacteriaceae bacterium]|nr:toll/interleukin-1 receptor domain-containing protein [Acidobacteriaceae bacterium]MBV9296846.1 toll/interleukin-1 receptor domain-containing protein [Acidobacteriaceae bacterium]MBV9763660.1 toll/interleukin-1 receptor domain-containing protein [Acidobacteriaceae bacterium]
MNSELQIFLSYAGEDAFEATLLQGAIESLLKDLHVSVWTYGRDQARDERSISNSLRDRIKRSSAAIILLSQFTLESGGTQWIELAYADAFGVPIFILLHHLTFDELRRADRGVPSLVLEGQCTPAADWKSLENGLRRCLKSAGREGLSEESTPIDKD